MIDHISYTITDIEKGREFYDATLALLGIERLHNYDMDDYRVSGYGNNNKPFFWIADEKELNGDEVIGKSRGFHVAFRANSVKEVKEWYEKCIELGAKDNGAPGPRPMYHPGYYGAFVIDPDGYRLEACFHEYEGDKS